MVEKTISPYFSLSESTKIVNMPLKISVGARIEDTQVYSGGDAALPFGQMYILSTDHTAYGIAGIGVAKPIFTESNYRYFLPNLDLSLGITDSLKARLDISQDVDACAAPPL